MPLLRGPRKNWENWRSVTSDCRVCLPSSIFSHPFPSSLSLNTACLPSSVFSRPFPSSPSYCSAVSDNLLLLFPILRALVVTCVVFSTATIHPLFLNCRVKLYLTQKEWFLNIYSPPLSPFVSLYNQPLSSSSSSDHSAFFTSFFSCSKSTTQKF